jgi:hypothetical protein
MYRIRYILKKNTKNIKCVFKVCEANLDPGQDILRDNSGQAYYTVPINFIAEEKYRILHV